MTYVELLQALEQRLGYQHMPLDPRVSTMKNLFESTPVHHELMQRLVQAIYRSNGCHAVTDPVNRDACFDAIGTVRQETLKTSTTDVDAYRLLDDLCLAVDDIFRIAPEPVTAGQKRTAEVVPFNGNHRRRAR